MKQKLLALFLIFALLLSTAACSTHKLPEEEEPNSATQSFTDDAGRELVLPARIRRVVPTGALTQILLLTLAPELVSGVASKLSEAERGFVPEELFSLPYFGSLKAGAELNIEELARSAPDLIIDMGEQKSSTPSDLDALQQQTSIPTVFLSLSLESFPEAYRKLGRLLGMEERAEALAQFCEQVYSRTERIMEQVGDGKVNCLYIPGQEGLNVIAAGSYHAELVDWLTNNLAVVDNPLGKGTGNEVTMDQISLWNPDFVIFGPDSIYDSVKSRPVWDQITAIRENRYVQIPNTPCNWMGMPPSVQLYLGLIWLPSVLYPQYCDYDVQEEILRYFRLFYGVELSQEEYDALTEKAFVR